MFWYIILAGIFPLSSHLGGFLMNHQLKRRLLIFSGFQIAILIFSFIFYHHLTLVSYINISFCITISLLLTSLLIYTIQTGFFDIVAKSFQFAFSRDHEKRKLKDIPPLSEVVAIDQRPLLLYGLLIGIFMGIGLAIYYLFPA